MGQIPPCNASMLGHQNDSGPYWCVLANTPQGPIPGKVGLSVTFAEVGTGDEYGFLGQSNDLTATIRDIFTLIAIKLIFLGH